MDKKVAFKKEIGILMLLVFATGLLNSVAELKLSCGWINTPANLKKSIAKNSYSTNRNIDYNDNVGFYNGDDFVANNPFASKSPADWETSFTYDEYELLSRIGDAGL